MLPVSRHPNTPQKRAINDSQEKDNLSYKNSKLIISCSLFFLFFFFCFVIFQFASRPYSDYDFEIKPLDKVQIKATHNNNNQPNTPISVVSDDRISTAEKTNLRHIAFGIAASAKLWKTRKNYIKLWWRPNQMRGAVWIDKVPPKFDSDEARKSLPPLKLSEDTSEFAYDNKEGDRSGLRISRIVSEAVRLNMTGVRWYVMGDDDTVFVAENLVRVLRRYDHNQFYYIGSTSESHVQNIYFSYKMAYGGGGFAISAALAEELARMQDRCMHRYPELYGSDDRIHACMAELGVPLTKEPGFHQFDVYGSVFGLLAAHPVAPLVTLHHLDLIQPIFPKLDRVNALKKLSGPMGLDSAALAQQSICYDPARNWTVSVSWGYAVQIFRGFLTPRELETPGRTFVNWHPKTDHIAHAFNTRPYSKNTCQTPFVYYLSEARTEPAENRTLTEYGLNREAESECDWKMANPAQIHKVEVYKTPDPLMWDKAPRRNCCRILPTNQNEAMTIDVGVCHAGEVAEM